MKQRLQNVLSCAGIASRRSAAAIISAGRVRVNGAVVYEKGYSVNPAIDSITCDGKTLSHSKKEYYLLHKPQGYVSTVKDPHADRTVIDLIPKKNTRLYPVGRLDKGTTGALLLTNDGALTYALTHPRFEVAKVYQVSVKGHVSDEALRQLKKGIPLEDQVTVPCLVCSKAFKGKRTLLTIEIHEGKKRQIRRMFDAIGHPVISLCRISFAGIALGALKIGAYRRLTKTEIRTLKRLAEQNRQ